MLEQLIRAQMVLQAEADGLDGEEEGNELAFNKDRVVRVHELQRANLGRMFANIAHTANLTELYVSTESATETTTPASAQALRGLRPMLVRNLQVGCRHKGRVLYGELCVEPVKMVSVQTVLVDEAGHATKLSIYNALPHQPLFNALQHQYEVQKMGILFPKGLKVAIKEPYFKIAMDGWLMIRVDNPADIVGNPALSSSGSRNMHGGEASSSSHHQPRVLLDARALRCQGAQAFAAQDWKHAIQLYTDMVKILLQSLDMSSLIQSSPSPASLESANELVLGFSNRAEARLRLKHFEAAESDASKALQLQKNHVKSLFRKGRALHGLHQYKKAVLCFTEARQIVDDEKGMNVKALNSALEASKICEKHARTGKYDLLKMWREVEKGREPVCGEYLGPVEIGAACDRTLGRGLLVTRDVEPGDLLVVSKAAAHAKLDYSLLAGLSEEEINHACTGSKSLSPVSNIYHEDLSLQVLQRAVSSKRFREQVYSLSPTDPNGVGNHIPSRDLFAPKLTLTGLHDVMTVEDEALDLDGTDIECVREVTRRCALEVAGEMAATFWLLPSFINHSCLPNACWVRVGKENLFVRAVCHLRKGQEVTISYLDNPALPLPLRTGFLQQCRGFECRCERCRFEKTTEPFTEQLVLKAVCSPVNIMGALEVVESLEWAFQNIKLFEDEEKKQWLRTSYSACYALLVSLDKVALQQRFKDLKPLEVGLRAVQETLGGSEGLLTAVRQRVNFEDCSPHTRRLVASMYTCLYGKQAPSDLRALVALRHSMVERES